jgi:hypothetical protein
MPRMLLALVLSALGPLVAAQCISLQGSSMCPRYQSLSINPTNLTNAWPFFADVTDVASFDREFAAYIAPSGQFAITKQLRQLGCTGYANGNVLQYQRTFLVRRPSCCTWDRPVVMPHRGLEEPNAD